MEMLALAGKNIRTWGRGKALALFAGCFLFAVSSRYGGDLSFEQHILSAIADHYYLTYFLMPMVLLSGFTFLADDSEQVILRFGSYHAYFWRKAAGTGLIALMMTGIQSAAVLLSGMGLPHGNTWVIDPGAVYAELFSGLGKYFSAPLSAFAAASLYQLLGMWFLFAVCIWIGHFAGRKLAAGIILAMYAVSAVWIKIPAFNRLPLTAFNHLLILHHNLLTPHRFLITAMTAAAALGMMAFSVRFLWRGGLAWRLSRRCGIAAYYRKALFTKENLLILCGTVLGITLYKRLRGTALRSGAEWICQLFSGHGTGYFSVLPFLELLITTLVPLYLLAAFTERTISGPSLFVTARAKGRKALLRGILRVSAQFLALYALLWLAAGVAGLFLAGYGLDEAAGEILLCEVLLKFLDVLLQYLVMFGFYLLTKQITAGFLALVAGNLLCVLPQGWAAYLPFGLSSAARLAWMDAETGISPSTAAFLLAALVCGMMLLFNCFGYRKLLN